MTSTADDNATRVAEMYDGFVGAQMPANLHFGYWSDDGDQVDLIAASERLTARLIERLTPASGQRILDLGCGVGGPALDLARSYDVEVVGITVSDGQVAEATARAQRGGLADRVRFELADAMELPFDDASFDGAWFFESLLHMPDKQRALSEAARVLRPGSRLALADCFRRPGYDEPTEVVNLIDIDDYAPLLREAGFTVLDIRDVTEHAVFPPPAQEQLREYIRLHPDIARLYGTSITNWLFRDEEGAHERGPGGFPGYVLITAQRR
ncbi:SAM-dependent methyltransferase [Micromonospora sp. WMMD730]|uniref:SAM-dependent methyltransferase n=1 Tax=Micromonospora sp. WMMD730 TaxID=3404128 RepID=UPI003B94A70B